MKDKMMIAMLLLGCVVISSLVTQMTAKPAEAGFGEQESEYPYELVKLFRDYSDYGFYEYYTFNRLTGNIFKIQDPDYPTEHQLTSSVELPKGYYKDMEPYKILSNTKGGCFVIDPETGETWFITAKGVSKKVLTIPSSAYSAPETGEDIGNE